MRHEWVSGKDFDGKEWFINVNHIKYFRSFVDARYTPVRKGVIIFFDEDDDLSLNENIDLVEKAICGGKE